MSDVVNKAHSLSAFECSIIICISHHIVLHRIITTKVSIINQSHLFTA